MRAYVYILHWALKLYNIHFLASLDPIPRIYKIVYTNWYPCYYMPAPLLAVRNKNRQQQQQLHIYGSRLWYYVPTTIGTIRMTVCIRKLGPCDFTFHTQLHLYACIIYIARYVCSSVVSEGLFNSSKLKEGLYTACVPPLKVPWTKKKDRKKMKA